MKIFISHASANKDYGNALVELLRGVGVHDDQIIFTSNTAYGIPTGGNIFEWLKTQIAEKPFVIYLLSEEYYKSVPCLNEMGAAWIVENEHAAIFTPQFNTDSKEFQDGALDPREIGFYLNDEDRLRAFIQQLDGKFSMSQNHVIINQQVKKYLSEVEKITTKSNGSDNKTIPFSDSEQQKLIDNAIVRTFSAAPTALSRGIVKQIHDNTYAKFTTDIIGGKLKDDELILVQYIIDKGDTKLGVGWRTDGEIEMIKNWEIVNDLNNKLSKNYAGTVGRFQMRGYTDVSETTSSDKPREVKLKSEIESNILDLPKEVEDKICSAISNNTLDKNALPF